MKRFFAEQDTQKKQVSHKERAAELEPTKHLLKLLTRRFSMVLEELQDTSYKHSRLYDITSRARGR